MSIVDLMYEDGIIPKEIWIEVKRMDCRGKAVGTEAARLAGLKNPEKVAAQCEDKLEAILGTDDAYRTLHDIHVGRAILLIGAGFSIDDGQGLTGDQVRDHLVDGLRRKLGHAINVLKDLPLPTVAGAYESTYGREELRVRLKSILESEALDYPLRHHHLLAHLPQFRILVTTNWDDLIEKGFEARAADDGIETMGGKKLGLSVARTSASTVDLDFERTILLKIYGDARMPEFRPRVTDKDFRDFQYDEPLLWNMLKHLTASYRVIVIGFRPDDENLRSILHTTALFLGDRAKPVCLVDPAPEVGFFVHNAQHIPLSAEVFLKQVQRFSDLQGGNVGQAIKDKPIGLARCWAEVPCDLAEQIQSKFDHLTHVEVVRPPRAGDVAAKQIVGSRAAILVRDIVEPHSRIAFSCGSTLKALIENASADWKSFDHVELYSTSVPLIDDTNIAAPVALVTLLAQRLARLKVKAHSYQLPSGFVPSLSNSEFHEYLGAAATPLAEDIEKVITAYLHEAAQSHVFVLGVGAISAGTTGFYEYGLSCLRACKAPRLAEAMVEEYMDFYRERLHQKLKYEGDLVYRPFHKCDKTVDEPAKFLDEFMNEDRLLNCLRKDIKTVLFKGVDVAKHYKEFLARIYCHVRSIELQRLIDATHDKNRTVALVATGRQKAAAVRSLCFAQIGDTLVIDEQLAKGMLYD